MDEYIESNQDCIDYITKLENRVETLKEALEVYANQNNWIEKDQHRNYKAYKIAEKALKDTQ